jgi:hypothetical protein
MAAVDEVRIPERLHALMLEYSTVEMRFPYVGLSRGELNHKRKSEDVHMEQGAFENYSVDNPGVSSVTLWSVCRCRLDGIDLICLDYVSV